MDECAAGGSYCICFASGATYWNALHSTATFGGISSCAHCARDRCPLLRYGVATCYAGFTAKAKQSEGKHSTRLRECTHTQRHAQRVGSLEYLAPLLSSEGVLGGYAGRVCCIHIAVLFELHATKIWFAANALLRGTVYPHRVAYPSRKRWTIT